MDIHSAQQRTFAVSDVNSSESEKKAEIQKGSFQIGSSSHETVSVEVVSTGQTSIKKSLHSTSKTEIEPEIPYSISAEPPNTVTKNKETRTSFFEKAARFFKCSFSFTFPSFLKSIATKKEECIASILNSSSEKEKQEAIQKLQKLFPGPPPNQKERANTLIRQAYGKRALNILPSNSREALKLIEKAIPDYFVLPDKLRSDNSPKKILAIQLKDFLLTENSGDETLQTAQTFLRKEISKGSYYEGMIEEAQLKAASLKTASLLHNNHYENWDYTAPPGEEGGQKYSEDFVNSIQGLRDSEKEALDVQNHPAPPGEEGGQKYSEDFVNSIQGLRDSEMESFDGWDFPPQ